MNGQRGNVFAAPLTPGRLWYKITGDFAETARKEREAMAMKDGHRVRGVIFTLLGGTCWGFSGTCGQYLFTQKGIQSDWLTMTRMVIAGGVLILFLLFKREKGMKEIWKDKTDVLQLLAFALGGLLFSQYTYLTAIFHSNAGTATVLQYLYPVLLMLLVCLVSRRLPGKREAICVVLAISGTFLIATHGNLHSLSISGEGLFWGLLSAVAGVSYSLLPTKIIAKRGSLLVTGYAMLIGGVFWGVISGVFAVPVNYDLGTVLAVLAISVIGTAVAYTLYLQGIQEIGPVKASMLASVEPVSASVCSFLWLKTPFTGIDLVGFALIIATVFLLSRRSRI